MSFLTRAFRTSAASSPPGDSPFSPELLRKVRQLELTTRGFVESLFSGEYLSVFHGRGMDFSHVRSYQPGDDVRAIDWKVTARRGEPFVRQFVEERDLLVMLVVDVSGSGRLGPGELSAGDVAARIAAALAFAANRNNDRVGLVLVSDRIEGYVPPGSGRRHVIRLLSDLVSHLRPKHRAGTDLSVALDHLARFVAGRALVFVISDFIQDHRGESFRSTVRRAARAHDVIAVRLSSRATESLPNVGWAEVNDPETGNRVLIDTGSRAVRQRFQRRMQQSRAELATTLAEAGSEVIEIDTEGDPLAPLANFFRMRRRVAR
jgi:uncharacterized protein (DUF58 family)